MVEDIQALMESLCKKTACWVNATLPEKIMKCHKSDWKKPTSNLMQFYSFFYGFVQEAKVKGRPN